LNYFVETKRYNNHPGIKLPSTSQASCSLASPF
jgi:hypothetical protein